MNRESRLSFLAKRRGARRAAAGGAVLFIVAMTIAVLAAVGMYALRSASTEIKTSGYERQSAQTHYLSEYGVLGASQEVSGTKAQLYVNLMVYTPDKKCTSLIGVNTLTAGRLAQSCRRMGLQELSGWNGASSAPPNGWATQALTPYTSPSQPGSLGSAPIAGDFYVELTDPGQVAPPAGFDLKLGLCFTQLTVSSTGVTQPIVTGSGAIPLASEGLETARARIIGGPLRCPQ